MNTGRFTKNFMKNHNNKLISKINKKNMVIIIIYILLIVFTMFLQRNYNNIVGMAGVISQIQVIFSAYLVIKVKKYGYFVSVSMNALISLSAAIFTFGTGNLVALPGVITPICSIITISIISLYAKNEKKRLIEVCNQKEEIFVLYEELATKEEEVRHQNTQIVEYNDSLKEKEEKLDHLAYIDLLTEIPNRKMILNRLELLVNLSSKNQMNFALAFIDLDNFKRINDSKGHHIGDLLLKAVVFRISKLLYKEDMLGRLGGDEFALIIQHELTESEIFKYVETIRIAIVESFWIEAMEYTISGSVGIAFYPQDGITADELLRCADIAMYKSKENGKNGIQVFNKQMTEEMLIRINLENRLFSSLQNNEIILLFQPQFTSNTKTLRGFEALARWRSPELGLVSPLTFIPIAEETRFIIPMGEWILKKACEMVKFIQDTYHRNIIIAVNISTVQIMDPNFISMVRRVLEESEVDGKYIEIEITESVFVSSTESVIGILNELKSLNMQIALDDFGTGYSSLSYLQKLPIDTLKIDKSFIDSIGKGTTKKQIVGSIISLVHDMEIAVIAEGVENEHQLDYLRRNNCDSIQGFLWGKPLEKTDVFKLIQQFN